MNRHLVVPFALAILSGCATHPGNGQASLCSSVQCAQANAPKVAPDGARLSFETCQGQAASQYGYEKVEGTWVLRHFGTKLVDSCEATRGTVTQASDWTSTQH